jgi:GT2 family glycosyltransferase
MSPSNERPTGPPPEVSVCIVNWNCRDMLRECLRSLDPARQQTRLEIIVVDNASPDGAADMVAAAFPGVTLVRNGDNAGFARANNQAAALARGEYLFFLNNDTLVPPGAVRRLVDFARSRPDAGLIGPRLRDGAGEFQTSFRQLPTVDVLLHRLSLLRWTGLFRRAYRRYRGRDGDFETTRTVEALMGAALLVRREVFDRFGPWDESFTFGGEDVELCQRVGRHHPVVYHPAVEITHYGRTSSRQQIGYVHTNMLIGVTRCLRKNGAFRPALWLYKTAATLDAPLQWLMHATQYTWRRARGQREKAEKCRVVMRGVGYFLRRGLPAFWRA